MVAGSLAAALGCGSDEKPAGSGGASGASGGGGSGTTEAGIPFGACWPKNPSCYLPNGAGARCLALSDNSDPASKVQLRMAQLQVTRPSSLTNVLVQDTVITSNLTLDIKECLQDGYGRFTWLIQYDPSSSPPKILTGGAPFRSKPKDGYCFLDATLDSFHVQPMEVAVTTSASGDKTVFTTKTPIETVYVPVYLDDAMTQWMIFPLHSVSLTDCVLSKDRGCIGEWDGDGLADWNNCKPDKTVGQTMQWKNGAKLTGYIGIEEADKVWITTMKQSLCVAISGESSKYVDPATGKCKRDGANKILATEKADWCSKDVAATPDQACSPPVADAFRLEGQFAANGVKITGTCAK
jgi:hypothetical protein